MMLVEEDKMFEDQIERMKQKNQKILEKFLACEEDRKLAENCGATISKNQNVLIRMRNPDKSKYCKPSVPRPKSYHEKTDNSDLYTDFYHFQENHKHGKYKRNYVADEIAYKDYLQFQQNHTQRPNNFSQRSNYSRRSPNLSSMDDNCVYKTRFDRQFSNGQSNVYKRQRFHNNVPNNRYYFDNDRENVNVKKNKFNNFQNGKAMNGNEEKVQETHGKSKQIFQKSNSVVEKKGKGNMKNRLNGNTTNNVHELEDVCANNKIKQSVFDDEYIDDTLEDLEQYKLKVDMEDFIVIDPESPDPILAMPIRPWTNENILNDVNENKTDSAWNNDASDLLNNVNERAKDYLNLINQNNIGHNDSNQISKLNNEFSKLNVLYSPQTNHLYLDGADQPPTNEIVSSKE